MRLPISNEAAFIIGVGLIGVPLVTVLSSRWQASRQATLQPDPNRAPPKRRVYDKS